MRTVVPAYNSDMPHTRRPEGPRTPVTRHRPPRPPIKAQAKNLNFYYGGTVQALGRTSILDLAEKHVTALIGPSGCGKSTFLRCFNRMHDLYPNNRYQGEILIHPDNINILGAKVDPIEVRMRISMVFQKPNPFPKSIYENVAYGLRVRGVVEGSRQPGRQGRAGAARRGAVGRGQGPPARPRLQPVRRPAAAPVHRARARHRPEILLFDEPASALDPIATAFIEELIAELKGRSRS